MEFQNYINGKWVDGGVRGTGNGHRQAGQAGLDLFTEWKSIDVDYSGKLQRAQIDNREQ